MYKIFISITLVLIIGLVSCVHSKPNPVQVGRYNLLIKINELQLATIKSYNNGDMTELNADAIVNFSVDTARYIRRNQLSRIKLSWTELSNTVKPNEQIKPIWDDVNKLVSEIK